MPGTIRTCLMHSWEWLEPVTFAHCGKVTSAFVSRGVCDFRAAGSYLHGLPYGRNYEPKDAISVLTEGRGTCSTKHAVLCRLAREQRIKVSLTVGMYEMNGLNAPGVGGVLSRYGLAGILEAHCYLRIGDKRIDVTGLRESGLDGTEMDFCHERRIAPQHIGPYKMNLHRQFLKQWIADVGQHKYDVSQLWNIREECIAAIEQSHND